MDFVRGACPQPTQNPQALSNRRAPEAMISAKAPFFVIIANTCLDPGATPKLTSG